MIVRSDGEIQAAVLDELAWDHRVMATGIEVSVHWRAVTLTGTVRSDAERLAAEAAARRLYGVTDVINSIEVQRPLKRETALVTEGMNRGAAMAQANHLLPVMRARRLDFIVLEHDEDLIGPAVRAELTAGHHTERPATRDDAAARAARGEAVASPR